ncbi:MAG TPA: archease [Gemmatimonadota bacterium]|jgi:SHS2 domain-containing protein
MPRGEFSEIDHAADLGLDLSGPDPGAVFEAAQRGLVQLLFGEIPALAPTAERDVKVRAEGYPELLKAWCEGLYRLIEEEGFVPLETRIVGEGPDRLEARVRGAIAPRELLTSASELKAVTWHQLTFERARAVAGGGGDGAARGEPARWRARVIFDV